MIDIKPLTYTAKQNKYINEAHHRWNFNIGATRSGKSYVDTHDIIPRGIRERAGLDGLSVILGVTKSTIERNVLTPMRETFGPELVGEIGSDNIATIFGEEVYCLGMEKVSQITKIRGASFKFVYGDEVAEWSEEAFSLIPSRMDKPYSAFYGSLNPQGVNHWLKKWIDDQIDKGADMYVQYYTLFDNTAMDKKSINNLVTDYKGNNVLYDRYILGKWVNAEGLIYLNYANDNKKYDITPMEAHNKKFLYINIGHDFGGNLSNHAFVCSGITEDYELIILSTLSSPAQGVDFNELFDTFCAFVDDCIDEWGFTDSSGGKYIDCIYCDSAEQTMINTYRNNTDYPIRNALKTDIIDRIRAFNALLGRESVKIVKGSCKRYDKRERKIYQDTKDALRDALNAACWSEEKDNTRVDDHSYNNDILDALEYSFEYYSRQLTDFNKIEQ